MSKMRTVDGYFTVELSLLLPIICFIFLILFYFFFYTMNMGIAEGVLEAECVKASDIIKNGGDIETGEFSYKKLNERDVFYLFHPDTQKVESQLKQNISKKLRQTIFMGKVQSLHVTVNGKKLTAKATIGVSLPIVGSVKIAGFHLFQGTVEKESSNFMEAESVRRWDFVESNKN